MAARAGHNPGFSHKAQWREASVMGAGEASVTDACPPSWSRRSQWREAGVTGAVLRDAPGVRSGAKRPSAGGRRGKERAASLRAEQRLAAGGPQGSPEPHQVAD